MFNQKIQQVTLNCFDTKKMNVWRLIQLKAKQTFKTEVHIVLMMDKYSVISLNVVQCMLKVLYSQIPNIFWT